MNVTICSYDGNGYFGGPYEWVKRLGPALRERGVNVSFLFFSDHRAEDSSTYQYLKNEGFDCRLLCVHSLTNFHDNTEDYVLWFIKQVQYLKSDFFIANSILPALYAGKWIKAMGIPVIGVLHSDDPNDEYMYDEFITGEKLFSLSAAVGVSDLLSQKVVVNNPYGIKVDAISCGTPIAIKKACYSNKPFKIIYAGKLTDVQKQITKTILGLCDVVEQISDVVVEVYGAGAQEEAAKSIVKKRGLFDVIVFKGLIDSSKIQNVFVEGQAFILLSDFEGLPVALMEAMSSGLVPVCTNIKSGIPQLVFNEKTGLLVDNRHDDLVRAIKRLKEDEFLWERLSVNAREFVIQEHSMNRVADKWLALFTSLEISKNNNKKYNTSLPSAIHLPPVHSSNVGKDHRKETFVKYLKSQWYRVLNLLKRI